MSKVVSTKNGVHYLGEFGEMSGEGVGRTVTLSLFMGEDVRASTMKAYH